MKKIVALILAAIMVLGLVSISTAEGEYFKIGYAAKTADGPYFVALETKLRAYCVEQGLIEKEEDLVVLNADQDPSKEAENFESFIANQYDLIFCDSCDPDSCLASEKAAMDAGIPVINVDSGVNDPDVQVTTVYSDNKQNGRAVGLKFAAQMGDEEIYAILLSGFKGNVAGKERRMGLFCGIMEGKLGITEEEAWKLSQECEDSIVANGSYTNEAAKFTVAGQGWGNWTINEALPDAQDLVVKTQAKLNCMLGENDQMLFGGMQAAEDAGLTGIWYVAAADGAKEAYDYIKGDKTTPSGQYFGSGENSPVMVAKTACEIAKQLLVDGAAWDSFEKVTLTPVYGVCADIVDERYEYGF